MLQNQQMIMNKQKLKTPLLRNKHKTEEVVFFMIKGLFWRKNIWKKLGLER